MLRKNCDYVMMQMYTYLVHHIQPDLFQYYSVEFLLCCFVDFLYIYVLSSYMVTWNMLAVKTPVFVSIHAVLNWECWYMSSQSAKQQEKAHKAVSCTPSDYYNPSYMLKTVVTEVK